MALSGRTSEYPVSESLDLSLCTSTSVQQSGKHVPTGKDTITQVNVFSKLATYSHLDIACGPEEKPTQPYIKFPAHQIGLKKRSFNPRWYSVHHWIEYSIQRDAVYCYPCRLLTTNPGRSDPAFVYVGYSDWKHATGKEHSISMRSHLFIRMLW